MSLPESLNSDWIKSIGALILGWLLNAFSPYLAERRERRKATARALANLLEIRSQFLMIESSIEEMNKIVAIPPDAELQLRIAFQNLLPNWEHLAQRYSEAVTLVSETDPLLADQLRSKEILRPILN